MTAPPRRRPPRLRSLAAVCGALAGIGGITHGIGEIIQGSVAPGGVVFDSWAQGPIARNLGGEPAMTLVGNLAATGILTIVASLAVVAWSLLALDRRHAGAGLVVLSVAMLVVGGGFGPPIPGMLAGLVAGAARASKSRWARRLAGRGGRLLAALWPILAVRGQRGVPGGRVAGRRGLLGAGDAGCVRGQPVRGRGQHAVGCTRRHRRAAATGGRLRFGIVSVPPGSRTARLQPRRRSRPPGAAGCCASWLLCTPWPAACPRHPR